jgi:hypothetical protein
MDAKQEWEGISIRIRSLFSLARALAAIEPGTRMDSPASFAGGILDLGPLLNAFSNGYSSLLTDSVISQFKATETAVDNLKLHGERSFNNAWSLAALMQLGLLEPLVTHHFSNNQLEFKSRALRGLHHLNRLIATDDSVQTRWRNAFKEGETACEQLAGAHLLWHGVWAFKCNGVGQKTDLVFPDYVDFEQSVSSSGAGLVLTEWKVWRGSGKISDKFQEAREQAKHYAVGVLGGIELKTYRFAIVVTEKQIAPIPANIDYAGGHWLHFNVCVEPEVPSRASRKNKVSA